MILPIINKTYIICIITILLILGLYMYISWNNKEGFNNSSDYRGKLSKTKSGRTCQKWTAQKPHSHTRTPEKYPNKGLGDHNYCRDPDGEGTIWCYTTDSDKRWGYCNINTETTTTKPATTNKLATTTKPATTTTKPINNSDYRGALSETKSGRTCQKWTAQEPHSHDRTPEKYPNKGLGDHNYCRNPDGEDTIWCYTTDSDKRWEHCDINNQPCEIIYDKEKCEKQTNCRYDIIMKYNTGDTLGICNDKDKPLSCEKIISKDICYNRNDCKYTITNKRKNRGKCHNNSLELPCKDYDEYNCPIMSEQAKCSYTVTNKSLNQGICHNANNALPCNQFGNYLCNKKPNCEYDKLNNYCNNIDELTPCSDVLSKNCNTRSDCHLVQNELGINKCVTKQKT